MNEAPVEGQRISRIWAFSCMLISLVAAIGLNETVAQGHGKAIFFGFFMTAFIAKIAQKVISEPKIIAFLSCVAAFHVILVFISPPDSAYPGGILFPAGILELIVLYYAFQRVARSL